MLRQCKRVVKMAQQNRRVKLKLVGFVNKTVIASLDQTWIEVLAEALPIDIDAGTGVYVCCWNYNITAPKLGHGWRNEITEKVRAYTEKFGRKRLQYTVRVVFPRINEKPNVTPRQDTTNVECPVTSNQDGHGQSAPVGMQGRARVVAQGVLETSDDDADSTASTVPEDEDWDEEDIEMDQASGPMDIINLQGSGHHMEGNGAEGVVEKKEEDEYAVGDDDASLVSGMSQQNLELGQQETKYRDVKTTAQQRIARFSNAFLLKVQHEIRTVETGLWDRNVDQFPLACYLLQELMEK